MCIYIYIYIYKQGRAGFCWKGQNGDGSMRERGTRAERKIEIGSVRTGGLRRFLSRPHDRYMLW